MITIVYLAISIPCILLCAGWLFADFQAKYYLTRADKWREDMGIAILYGALLGAVWPLGVPSLWLLTGFAQHGWCLNRPKEEK